MLLKKTYGCLNRRRIVALALFGLSLGSVALALIFSPPDQDNAPFVLAPQSATFQHQQASPKVAKGIAASVAHSSGSDADPRAETPNQSAVTSPASNDQPTALGWGFK